MNMRFVKLGFVVSAALVCQWVPLQPVDARWIVDPLCP